MFIQSFLKDRRFFVAVGKETSNHRPITAGVPQGSCLSPTLYSVYTNDVPCAPGTSLALYADDTAYIATSLSPKHAAVKLQRALDLLPEWLQKWRLTANPGKTQAIVFGQGKLPSPLTMANQEIPWKKEATYLGVTIDHGITMRNHITKVAGRAKAALMKLRPLISSSLPLRQRLALYKLYIRPHITYAAPAWYALAAESNRKRLRAVQNIALRRVVSAPRYVRNATIARDLRIEPLDEFIKHLAQNMFKRADESIHPHLQRIAPWHTRPPDHRKPFPRELVHAGPQSPE